MVLLELEHIPGFKRPVKDDVELPAVESIHLFFHNPDATLVTETSIVWIEDLKILTIPEYVLHYSDLLSWQSDYILNRLFD